MTKKKTPNPNRQQPSAGICEKINNCSPSLFWKEVLVVQFTDKNEISKEYTRCAPVKDLPRFDTAQLFSQKCHPSIIKCTTRSYSSANAFTVLFCFVFFLTSKCFHFLVMQMAAETLVLILLKRGERMHFN